MSAEPPVAKGVEPIVVGWSGGKDSSLAVHAIRRDPSLHIDSLITTVTEAYDRISMHGVRVSLLERQAAAIGYPLTKVSIPSKCTNEIYEQKMEELMRAFYAKGIRRCAYGDLFLEDIREYRDRNLAKVDMTAIYPVWGIDTTQLAREFVDQGFRAVLTCVNPKKLDPEFCGRELDHSFLDELPEPVDPCGENGEFHTFVFDGPIFSEPVAIERGEIVERDGFWFADFVPRDAS